MKRKVLFLVAMMAILSQSLFAQSGWTPPGNMQYNMQVIGQLEFNDAVSDSPDDIVGAFYNDTVVRGVASPDEDGFVYLTILSDSIAGETITLKADIESANVIYSVTIYDGAGNQVAGNELSFTNSAILGSYDAPYRFVATATTYNITITNVFNDDFAEGATNPDVALIEDVVEGSDTTIVITPEVGSHILSVYIDNGTDDPVNVFDETLLGEDGSFTYTFQNLQSNWTLIDTFAINRMTLTFIAGTNGQLTGPSTTPNVDGDYIVEDPTQKDTIIYENVPYGVQFGIVTASPIEPDDYEFVNWSDGVTTAIRPSLTEVTEHINVKANFVPKDWTPNDSYQFTMTVIGNLFVEGNLSTNSNDLVGAFIGGVCHGVASPDEDGLVFLSIGSNNATSDEVILQIWTSQTGTCNASYPLTFLSNDQIGTLNLPYVIECEITKDYTIPAGYTWFSANIETNTEDNPRDPDNYFTDAWYRDAANDTLADPSIDDRIIGQTKFAVYATVGGNDEWVGSLTAIDAKKMYRLFMNETRYLQLSGSAVANTPITLNAGYTWLGYLPREALPIAEALADFSGVVANDRIISQNKFAIYNGTGWQGSLTTLTPGKGYIVQLANNSTLTYPAYVYNNRSMAVAEDEFTSPAGFDVVPNMKNTMMLIGQLNESSLSSNDVVYAFIDGECRGMAKTAEDGNIYLSIGENTEEAKEVSFKVWLDEKGKLANIDQTITFAPLKAIGDLNNPFTFNISEANSTDSWLIGKAYPNPFNEQTIIPVWLKESAQLTVNVYNNMGQTVKTLVSSAASTGVNNIVLQKENLEKGVYYYTVNIQSANNTIHETGKLIIQ